MKTPSELNWPKFLLRPLSARAWWGCCFSSKVQVFIHCQCYTFKKDTTQDIPGSQTGVLSFMQINPKKGTLQMHLTKGIVKWFPPKKRRSPQCRRLFFKKKIRPEITDLQKQCSCNMELRAMLCCWCWSCCCCCIRSATCTTSSCNMLLLL